MTSPKSVPGGARSGLRAGNGHPRRHRRRIHFAQLTSADVVRTGWSSEIVDAYAKAEEPGLTNGLKGRSTRR